MNEKIPSLKVNLYIKIFVESQGIANTVLSYKTMKDFKFQFLNI